MSLSLQASSTRRVLRGLAVWLVCAGVGLIVPAHGWAHAAAGTLRANIAADEGEHHRDADDRGADRPGGAHCTTCLLARTMTTAEPVAPLLSPYASVRPSAEPVPAAPYCHGRPAPFYGRAPPPMPIAA